MSHVHASSQVRLGVRIISEAGEKRLGCELYAEGLLCEVREGGAFSVRHRRQQHVNQSTAFMGQGWPLKIRRNVYYCNVKIPGQENEVLKDLGARKRNHIQFFEPFLFSPYYNCNVSLGNYLTTLKFEFLGELNLLAFARSKERSTKTTGKIPMNYS